MTQQELTRKERDFQRRESEILSAAAKLFAGDHWEQVTVAQIAESAEIGKGTVYKHFSTKEDIYARLALNFHYELMAIFKSLDQEAGVLSFMKEAIYQSFRFYKQHTVCAKLSTFCKRSDFRNRISDGLFNEFVELDEQFEQLFGAVLEAGIREGVIRHQPIKHLMVGLEASFEGALFMLMNESYTDCSELSESEFVEVITNFMINALAA
jgi:AcrR family transcriptional regulator